MDLTTEGAASFPGDYAEASKAKGKRQKQEIKSQKANSKKERVKSGTEGYRGIRKTGCREPGKQDIRILDAGCS